MISINNIGQKDKLTLLGKSHDLLGSLLRTKLFSATLGLNEATDKVEDKSKLSVSLPTSTMHN